MKTEKKEAAYIRQTSSFYSDQNEESFLYAILLRSPIASGTIRSVTPPDLPAGYALFTAKDIPGENIIRTLDTEFPVFASENVSYPGEPIGILTGKNYAVLNRLASETEITYTQAFSESKQKSKKNDTDILASRRYEYGDFEQAWKQAKFKSDKTYELKLQLRAASETDGAFCRVQGKTISIYTPSRWTAHLYRNLCAVLNTDKTHIHIHKTLFSATTTNAPWHNTVLSVQCALAAMLTKQPVLLSLTRREQMLYIDRPLPLTIRHKTALNDEGAVTAAFVSVNVDAGAFNPFIAPLLDRLAIASLGVYKPENCITEACAYRSNTPPGAPSMQWADYHGFYAAESQIQELARLSGLNSADIRLKNIFPAKKTEQTFPFLFEAAPIHEVIHRVIKKSDFYRKYSAYKQNGFQAENIFSTVPLRGIGLSCGYEGSGFLGTKISSLRHSLEVSLEKDGSAVIYAKASSETVAHIWKKTAAELLSIPVESVRIDSCNPQAEESELPETFMNNISIMSRLVKQCCTSIQKLRFREALPIRVKRSHTAGKKNSWNTETFSGTPFYNTSWAAAAAEIDLNPKTYTYTVRNIWISIDGGTILYDSKAETVINQCIRKLFLCSEELQSSPLPAVFIDFIPGSTEPKQIGELVFNVLPAAIGNAVCQALQKRLEEFPVSPQAIYRCITESIQEKNNAHTDEHKQ